MVLMIISLMITHVEYLFMNLLAIERLSFVKMFIPFSLEICLSDFLLSLSCK